MPTGTAPLRRVLRWVASALGELLRLVVPLSCAGCGAPDVVVCPACRADLGSGARRVDHEAPRLVRVPSPPPDALPPGSGQHGRAPADGHGDGPGDGLTSRWPVVAGASGAGNVRTLVVAWKDRGRTDCSSLLGDRLREVTRAGASWLDTEALRGRELWVVPAPSTRSAARRRGREHTVELARAVTSELDGLSRSSQTRRACHGGSTSVGHARLVRALAHRRRRTVDQTGLGARARGRNLAGALRVRRRALPRGATGAACVLVDDVLTTGATLAECERALQAAGHEVVLGVVLLATPAAASSETTSPEPATGASPVLLVHSRPPTG